MKNINYYQNENKKLYEEKKKLYEERRILNLKINKNENKIKNNNKKIQENCFHNFEQYSEYQEPTSYKCNKCKLNIYYYQKYMYKDNCLFI